jgi:hypothetical protein
MSINFSAAKDEEKRSFSFAGFSEEVLKREFSGDNFFILKNRSVAKDVPNLNIYLDIAGCELGQIYKAAGEQLKVRITQAQWESLSETKRAKILKDGYWVLKVKEWIEEKRKSSARTPEQLIKAAMKNGLSKADIIALLESLPEDGEDEDSDVAE